MKQFPIYFSSGYVDGDDDNDIFIESVFKLSEDFQLTEITKTTSIPHDVSTPETIQWEFKVSKFDKNIDKIINEISETEFLEFKNEFDS